MGHRAYIFLRAGFIKRHKIQERVCSLKDRLGGGLYIDIFSVKNVGIESIYRKMPYKKTLFLLYFWLLLGF